MSATLKQLVMDIDWSNVSGSILEAYPGQEKNLEGYEKVFKELKDMDSVKSNDRIRLTECVDDFENMKYVDVTICNNTTYWQLWDKEGRGKYDEPNGEWAEKEVEWGSDFLPWNQWLGMSIDDVTMDSFNTYAIVAHCLFNMTFWGFDEKTIQENDKDTGPGRSCSIEELFNEQENDDEDDDKED